MEIEFGLALIGNEVKHGTLCLFQAAKKRSIVMRPGAEGDDRIKSGNISIGARKVNNEFFTNTENLIISCLCFDPLPERFGSGGGQGGCLVEKVLKIGDEMLPVIWERNRLS
jgi:hypothetical protein